MNQSHTQVFASTTFFLQHGALITSRSEESTINPCFDATFRVFQIITDDFLVYLENETLELQVCTLPYLAANSKLIGMG